MKKIISFSLWGDNPKYCIGAIKNAQLRSKYYPDWICKFYIQEGVPIHYIKQLEEIKNVEIIIREYSLNWKFTVERFLAVDDENISHVIFRDVDSRLNQREADAVNEWIKEDTAIHVMKDHPYHGHFPILAGMWGINKSKFQYSMKQTLNSYMQQAHEEHYFYDQVFLNNYIWPNFYKDSTIHDEFFIKKPFPTKRTENQFVGQSFDENDNSPIEHIDDLKKYENR